jgi:hypothetical protein
MNRTILIVICDFLLVSLLAFSTVDINKATDKAVERPLSLEIATNEVPAESGRDLAAVMRVALEDERKSRDLLMGELAKTRQTTTEREKDLQAFQQQLLTKEQETLRLHQEQTNLQSQLSGTQQQLAGIQKELTGAQQQYAAAQTNIQTLTQQLSASASQSNEKLAALEAELKKKAEQAAALQNQLSDLAKSNLVVAAERQRLAGQLQVAEVEKRHATEQVIRMQEQVKVERDEKAKLAEGVKALASKSGELTQEIRENRPLAPNTIFNDFVTNRVQAHINASRPGLIGTSRRKATETILVSDGTNTMALCHVKDTPLTLYNPGADWESLTGTLGRYTTQIPIKSLAFHLQDPRVVLMPLTTAEAKQLGARIYRMSPDPYKFQDAVLVGASEGYYGECRFEIDLSTPDYVRLDRSFLKGLFGKFNPSAGDLVFSKTGELLGVMANGTYCMMIRNFDAAASFQFGPNVKQRTADTLALLYGRVAELPLKLQ